MNSLEKKRLAPDMKAAALGLGVGIVIAKAQDAHKGVALGLLVFATVLYTVAVQWE